MTLDALPEWLRIMRFSRVVGKDKSEGSAREYYSARCEIDYSDSNLQRMLSAFYRDVDDGGRNDMIKKQHTSSLLDISEFMTRTHYVYLCIRTDVRII